MRNIRNIFFRDVKALLKNPFAFIIAGGLCIIPALYAWFNIYSNWDPYGNTGNIRIAAVSNDKGYTAADGNTVCAADTVMEALKENDSICWVMAESEEDAVKGVYEGRRFYRMHVPGLFKRHETPAGYLL